MCEMEVRLPTPRQQSQLQFEKFEYHHGYNRGDRSRDDDGYRYESRSQGYDREHRGHRGQRSYDRAGPWSQDVGSRQDTSWHRDGHTYQVRPRRDDRFRHRDYHSLGFSNGEREDYANDRYFPSRDERYYDRPDRQGSDRFVDPRHGRSSSSGDEYNYRNVRENSGDRYDRYRDDRYYSGSDHEGGRDRRDDFYNGGNYGEDRTSQSSFRKEYNEERSRSFDDRDRAYSERRRYRSSDEPPNMYEDTARYRQEIDADPRSSDCNTRTQSDVSIQYHTTEPVPISPQSKEEVVQPSSTVGSSFSTNASAPGVLKEHFSDIMITMHQLRQKFSENGNERTSVEKRNISSENIPFESVKPSVILENDHVNVSGIPNRMNESKKQLDSENKERCDINTSKGERKNGEKCDKNSSKLARNDKETNDRDTNKCERIEREIYVNKTSKGESQYNKVSSKREISEKEKHEKNIDNKEGYKIKNRHEKSTSISGRQEKETHDKHFGKSERKKEKYHRHENKHGRSDKEKSDKGSNKSENHSRKQMKDKKLSKDIKDNDKTNLPSNFEKSSKGKSTVTQAGIRDGKNMYTPVNKKLVHKNDNVAGQNSKQINVKKISNECNSAGDAKMNQRVSGSVSKKENSEFSTNLDKINVDIEQSAKIDIESKRTEKKDNSTSSMEEKRIEKKKHSSLSKDEERTEKKEHSSGSKERHSGLKDHHSVTKEKYSKSKCEQILRAQNDCNSENLSVAKQKKCKRISSDLSSSSSESDISVRNIKPSKKMPKIISDSDSSDENGMTITLGEVEMQLISSDMEINKDTSKSVDQILEISTSASSECDNLDTSSVAIVEERKKPELKESILISETDIEETSANPEEACVVKVQKKEINERSLFDMFAPVILSETDPCVASDAETQDPDFSEDNKNKTLEISAESNGPEFISLSLLEHKRKFSTERLGKIAEENESTDLEILDKTTNGTEVETEEETQPPDAEEESGGEFITLPSFQRKRLSTKLSLRGIDLDESFVSVTDETDGVSDKIDTAMDEQDFDQFSDSSASSEILPVFSKNTVKYESENKENQPSSNLEEQVKHRKMKYLNTKFGKSELHGHNSKSKNTWKKDPLEESGDEGDVEDNEILAADLDEDLDLIGNQLNGNRNTRMKTTKTLNERETVVREQMNCQRDATIETGPDKKVVIHITGKNENVNQGAIDNVDDKMKLNEKLGTSKIAQDLPCNSQEDPTIPYPCSTSVTEVKTEVKEEPDWQLFQYTQEPDIIFLSDENSDDDAVAVGSQSAIILDSDSDEDDLKNEKKRVKSSGTIVIDSDFEFDFQSAESGSDRGSDFEPDTIFQSMNRTEEIMGDNEDACKSDEDLFPDYCDKESKQDEESKQNEVGLENDDFGSGDEDIMAVKDEFMAMKNENASKKFTKSESDESRKGSISSQNYDEFCSDDDIMLIDINLDSQVSQEQIAKENEPSVFDFHSEHFPDEEERIALPSDDHKVNKGHKTHQKKVGFLMPSSCDDKCYDGQTQVVAKEVATYETETQLDNYRPFDLKGNTQKDKDQYLMHTQVDIAEKNDNTLDRKGERAYVKGEKVASGKSNSGKLDYENVTNDDAYQIYTQVDIDRAEPYVRDIKVLSGDRLSVVKKSPLPRYIKDSLHYEDVTDDEAYINATQIDSTIGAKHSEQDLGKKISDTRKDRLIQNTYGNKSVNSNDPYLDATQVDISSDIGLASERAGKDISDTKPEQHAPKSSNTFDYEDFSDNDVYLDDTQIELMSNKELPEQDDEDRLANPEEEDIYLVATQMDIDPYIAATQLNTDAVVVSDEDSDDNEVYLAETQIDRNDTEEDTLEISDEDDVYSGATQIDTEQAVNAKFQYAVCSDVEKQNVCSKKQGNNQTGILKRQKSETSISNKSERSDGATPAKKVRLSIPERKTIHISPQKLKTNAEKRSSGSNFIPFSNSSSSSVLLPSPRSKAFTAKGWLSPPVKPKNSDNLVLKDAAPHDMWLSKAKKPIPGTKIDSGKNKRKRTRKEDPIEELRQKTLEAKLALVNRSFKSVIHPSTIADPSKKHKSTCPETPVEDVDDVDMPTASQIAGKGLPVLNYTGMITKKKPTATNLGGRFSSRAAILTETMLESRVTTSSSTIPTTSVTMATSTAITTTISSAATSRPVSHLSHIGPQQAITSSTDALQKVGPKGYESTDTGRKSEHRSNPGKLNDSGHRPSLEKGKSLEHKPEKVKSSGHWPCLETGKSSEHKPEKVKSSGHRPSLETGKSSEHKPEKVKSSGHRPSLETGKSLEHKPEKVKSNGHRPSLETGKSSEHKPEKVKSNGHRPSLETGKSSEHKPYHEKVKNIQNRQDFTKGNNSEPRTNSVIDKISEHRKFGQEKRPPEHRDSDGKTKMDTENGIKTFAHERRKQDSLDRANNKEDTRVDGRSSPRTCILKTISEGKRRESTGSLLQKQTSNSGGGSSVHQQNTSAEALPPKAIPSSHPTPHSLAGGKTVPPAKAVPPNQHTFQRPSSRDVSFIHSAPQQPDKYKTIPPARAGPSSGHNFQQKPPGISVTSKASSSNRQPPARPQTLSHYVPGPVPRVQTIEKQPAALHEVKKLIGFDNFIKVILKWTPVWFEEKKKMDDSKRRVEPPQVTNDLFDQEKHDLFPLVERYDSYQEYSESFMLPLLLYETWESCYQEWRSQKKNRSLKVFSNNFIVTSPYLKQFELLGLIRRHDREQGNYSCGCELVRLKLQVKSPNGCQDYSILGWVKEISFYESPLKINALCQQNTRMAQFRKNDSQIIKFHVLIRKRNFVLVENAIIDIEPVCPLTTTMRQYQALAHLPMNTLHRDLLYPTCNTTYCDQPVNMDTSTAYNASQLRAINTVAKIVSLPRQQTRVCLLQGPPGTGKSRTIVGIIERLMKISKGKCRVCLCTPSNAAIDELLRRLNRLNKTKVEQEKMRIVRLGKNSSADITNLRLENCMKAAWLKKQKTDMLQRLPASLKGELDRLENKIQDTRMKLATTSDNLKTQKLTSDLRKFMKEREDMDKKHLNITEREPRDLHLNMKLCQEVLSTANVIAGTLSRMGDSKIKMWNRSNTEKKGQSLFDCIIVDEATQAVELDTLIPLQYGTSKLVLVGDPEQLPPTVLSQVCQDNKLNMSLFERLVSFFRYNKTGPNPVVLLDTQYRMDPEIAVFPNKYIYEGKIKDDGCVVRRRPHPLVPYLLYNLLEGEELLSQVSRSLSNPLEAQFITHLCEIIIKQAKVKPPDIGVIAPYSKQKDEIRTKLRERGMGTIDVSTVDGFQGQERDVIIMSCVRANSSGGIGFLGSRNRMNVSLTRAKYALFVVGHLQSLMQASSEWKALLTDAQERGKVIQVTPNSENQALEACLRSCPPPRG